MSLNAKVVLLLCALFATYGAVDYAVQREVILPSFEALEADLAGVLTQGVGAERVALAAEILGDGLVEVVEHVVGRGLFHAFGELDDIGDEDLGVDSWHGGC